MSKARDRLLAALRHDLAANEERTLAHYTNLKRSLARSLELMEEINKLEGEM